MEPSNLNSEASEDAALAALMRNGRPEITDGGFTARVLAALPLPARRAVPARNAAGWLAYSIGGCAGLLLVLWRAGGPHALGGAARECGNALVPLAVTLGDPWIALAIGIAAASLGIAAWSCRLRWRPW